MSAETRYLAALLAEASHYEGSTMTADAVLRVTERELWVLEEAVQNLMSEAMALRPDDLDEIAAVRDRIKGLVDDLLIAHGEDPT